MTVKDLMNILDKNTSVEIYEEFDADPVFFSKKNNAHCARGVFEKIKDRKIAQITASEEDLIFVYIDSGIYGEND